MEYEKILEQFADVRKLLIAVGDETRQLIIAVLAEKLMEENPYMRVGEITEKTRLSRPAVSHHLKILLDEDVIGVLPKGTMNFYYLKLGGEWGTLVSLINGIEEVMKEENVKGKCDWSKIS